MIVGCANCSSCPVRVCWVGFCFSLGSEFLLCGLRAGVCWVELVFELCWMASLLWASIVYSVLFAGLFCVFEYFRSFLLLRLAGFGGRLFVCVWLGGGLIFLARLF